uniref:Putative ovule protein n=1 Tax=Solanum chacoense TaxID=4108 RepID=A0A0V0ICM3_SOLCH
MQRKNEELKNGKAEVEAKQKMYLEKLKELESRVSLQEEETAKNRAVDVSLIQNMVEDLEAKDDDAVQVNSKASATNGDLEEKQLSPPTPPSIHSTANGNGMEVLNEEMK